jgi:hypothetical protein
MPFVPLFESILESVVLDNILKMFKDNMKPALDAFYSAENLPDFAQRTLGNFIQLTQPTLAVEPMRGGKDESGDYDSKSLRINIYLTVDDANPDEAVRKLFKYKRAAEAILTKATFQDFTQGIAVNKVMPVSQELSWDYNQVAKDVNLAKYLKSVTFDLTLKYSER